MSPLSDLQFRLRSCSIFLASKQARFEDPALEDLFEFDLSSILFLLTLIFSSKRRSPMASFTPCKVRPPCS